MTKIINEWDSGIEIVEKPTITITQEVNDKIIALSDAMGGLEWGGYLTGIGTTVTGLIIPKQTVTSVTWEVIEAVNDPNIIGTVHSHHKMSAFTSDTDKEYLCSNYTVTLIFSYKDGLCAWYSATLPDKNKIILEADLDVLPAADYTDFINESVKIINERVIATPITPAPVAYQSKAPIRWDENDPTDDYIPDAAAIAAQFADYGCDDCASTTGQTVFYDANIILCEQCAKLSTHTLYSTPALLLTDDELIAERG